LSAGLGGRDVRSLLMIRQSAMRLLAATPDGVFEYSSEQGVWQNQSRWELPASRPGAPAATVVVWDLFQRSPSEPIHAATSRGLFVSRDGRDWKALRLSSNPVSVYGVATLGHDGRTIVAVTADAAMISRDGGRSWSPLDLGAGPALKVHRVATHAATPDVLFVGTNLGLYRSTDAGRAWERFGRGVPFSPVMDIVISPENPKHVIVGGTGGVFHSLNGGDWFARTDGGAGLDTVPVQALAFHPQGGLGMAILAASRTNGIFRSGASLLSHPE
ncbi:MAG: WD40/YVTN/BNR-like repeat-containing protein, partial [Terriglobia bacterium]